MGKAIVYCQTCGKSLREEDFDRRRAFRQEHSNFCVECRPELKAAVSREPTPPPAPRRSVSERVPLARPPDAERPGSTARIGKAQDPPGRSAALLWIGIGIVVVLVALAAGIVLKPGETRGTPSTVVAPN